jgi:NAD(P)H dehydrogenase (quinone)
MTVVSIVYHTGKGHTGVLAEAVARGAASVDGVQVHLLPVLGEHVVSGHFVNDELMKTLDSSDAIIFGAPTLMGSVSAVFKAFMEATFSLWFEQRWKDKIASAFTNSASQSGDKLSSLFQLAVFAAQLSMIWVPVGDPPGNNWSGGTVNHVNRLGSWMGVMGQSNADQGPELAPSQGDRVTAERHGRRVAQIACRWMEGAPYQTERFRESIRGDATPD